MIRNKISFILIFILLVSTVINAQYSETIMKAMNDELARNKEDLVFKDFEKPFFIAYSLFDLKLNRYSSSLGGVYQFTNEKRKQGYARVMIGDYKLTDENFQDQTNRYQHNDGSIALPYEDNYDGIRRHFWLATNNVYKNASESYRNKNAALKQQNMSIDELPAPDFTQEKPREYIIKEQPLQKSNIDLGELSQLLSAEFKAYSDIVESFVNIIETDMYRYYLNTEGTKIAVPEQRIHFEIVASTYNKSNEVVSEGLYFDAQDKDHLLPIDSLKNYLHTFAGKLLKMAKLDNWEDSYSGPVLFENQAIYRLLLYRSFVKGNGFIASREPLIKTKNNGVLLANNNTLEKRMDKRVASKNVFIYDIPCVKNYKGIDLFGYYAIDYQGVIPVDTLPLVDSGVLRSLLTDRIPIKTIQKSNGHCRTSNNNGQIFKGIGPGNVFFKCSDNKSDKELRSKLCELADDEGLDYAMVIRPAVKGSLLSPIEYFKVDLQTGEETQVYGVNTSKIGIQSLKDVVAASNQEEVLNVYHNYHYGNRQYAETPASFIYPDILLLEDVELTGNNKPIKKNPPIIPNPLKK
ncbi:MAG: hypothetical protein JW717_11960 [Marinilabiliaceae bacterium]|nr:hypothetical protein [Marinilabiliaceae bacterium]